MKVTKKIHEKDTMTSEERLQAVINIQVPDRVPVSPRIYYFAAQYAGVDNADLYDPTTWNDAINKCFRDLGPWDFYAPWNFYHVEVLSLIFPMKVLEPGIGLPRDAIHQYLEEEIMEFEDYQWIMKMARQIPDLAFLRLVMKWLPKIWGHVQPGIKRAAIALHGSSNDFMSPDTFRRLSLPSLKDMVERLKADGMPSILHCDGNWDLNFEALRELPAGCAVVELDGSSDIFKAKEIIGDRMCISGDVPADLLALGSTTEVDEYCHHLIEEVGKGGGFILSSGCEVAPNAKPENVKAMMESVVKYGYYDRVTAPEATATGS